MSVLSRSIGIAVLAVTLSGAAAWAQSGGSSGGASGTNSAGTANSSGSPQTTGSPAGRASAGTGRRPDGAPSTGNAKVDAQDRAVERKVKSICKGC